jgi:hypothetical protein
MDQTRADDIDVAVEPRTPEDTQKLLDAVASFDAHLIENKEAKAETSVELPPAVEFVQRKRTPAELIELTIVAERFKVALKERSFSGRNPEMGPMIKCAQCGTRHRDNVKHEPIKYKDASAQTQQGRPVGNGAGWRAKPGKPVYIKELKKVLTLTR